MPYGNYRNRRYRRRSYRGRSGYRKPTTKSQDVQLNLSKLWRQIKYVKGMINSEKKFHDSSGSTAASATPTVHALTQIAQGDSQATRDGNSILVRNLRLSMLWSNHASATAGTFCRCVIVKDNQQVSDTDPQWLDVFESATVTSPLNAEKIGRFQLLKDMTFTLNNDDKENKIIKLNLPLKHHVRYNGTAGTDIQKGGLYLMYCSNQGANTAAVSLEARVSFYDN